MISNQKIKSSVQGDTCARTIRMHVFVKSNRVAIQLMILLYSYFCCGLLLGQSFTIPITLVGVNYCLCYSIHTVVVVVENKKSSFVFLLDTTAEQRSMRQRKRGGSESRACNLLQDLWVIVNDINDALLRNPSI